MEEKQNSTNNLIGQENEVTPNSAGQGEKKPLKKTSLLRNVIYNNFYQILVLLVPLITTPYVSRVLQADGVGIYSYTHSLVTYFTMFAAFGTLSYGQREIARRRENKQDYSKAFWEIELVVVFSSAACLAVWIILSIIYTQYSRYMLIFSLSILATTLDISWFYAGLEEYKNTVSFNAIFKILSIVFIFLFVKTEADVDKYILIYAGSLFLGNLSIWMFLPRYLCKTKVDFSALPVRFKETLIYFIPAVATSIYTVLDKSLIGLITQQDELNGYYEQATRIINTAKTVSFIAIVGVMESRASYLYAKKDEASVQKYLNGTLEVVLLLSVGFCFGIIGVAKNFVPIFFGDGYDATVYLLYIFSPIIVVTALSFLLGGLYYTPVGRRKESTKYLIIGSVCNLVLNLIFIPFLQANGAAIASLIAEIIITALYIFNCRKMLTIGKIIKSVWKKLIAGVVMLAYLFASYLFPIDTYLLLAVQFFGGVLIYFLVLIITRDSCMKEVPKLFKKQQGEDAHG